MFKFRKKSHQEVLDNIPNHIGIIMDGNGRWAKKRLQPRVMGHKAGMDALQKVTIEASQLGVKVLTVYAFSTENWSRPQDEVKFIMNLPVEFFNKYVPELDKNNVRILTIGDNSRLPKETLDALEKAANDMAQAMYQSQAGQQAAGDAAGNSTSANDDVVDADFQEKK